MKIRISPKNIFKTALFVLFGGFFFGCGYYVNTYYTNVYNAVELLNPFVESGELISKPLLTYSIANLQKRLYEPSEIVLEKIIAEEETYTTLLFSYTTLGKKMTGQINIPDNITANPEQEKKVIVLLRGYVPEDIYETGTGTKNAAAAFAQEGYITLAPDFFGFGGSDPEPEDTWAARFEKPITVIELLESIKKNGIPLNLASERTSNTLDLDVVTISDIGVWAHSNGGQIALTVLEILQKPIPTTLWAPVTAPFPYSILYFSDEQEDEGKEQRKWISLFEEKYDVFEFSLTQHLESLTGPVQIQHGNADDAALIFWSQEFVAKVEAENQRRENIIKQQKELVATSSALQATVSAEQKSETEPVLNPIEITLITYPNTNHNMVPSWNKAIQKDLQFFNKYLE
ncbi:MAG: hypothetical protein BroJett025_06130 [Patescibacteria group bacterium]|nr:MAG: hypothetical protein BroJett025_06130 [Patescibacteria group bacterium]